MSDKELYLQGQVWFLQSHDAYYGVSIEGGTPGGLRKLRERDGVVGF